MRQHRLLLAVPVLLAACGGTSTTEPGLPGLTILGGADQVDTIGAVLAVPITVVVRDDQGHPRVGALVRFGGNDFGGVGVIRGPGDSPTFSGWDTTDHAGHAGARLRFYGRAGAAVLPISVDDHGLADTARFTVLTGQPALLSLEPSDTAVALGREIVPRVRVTDMGGNPTGEVAVLETTTSAMLQVEGTVVRGIGHGSGTLRATWKDTVRTATVHVVPQGRLAATVGGQVFVYDLDGTHRSTVAIDVHGGGATSWHPDGVTLAWDRTWPDTWIVTGTVGGSATPIAPAGLTREEVRWPAWSPDGEWLYFRGGRGPDSDAEVWRTRQDGSGTAQVGPAGNARADVSRLDISPDGALIAVQHDSSVVNAEPPLIRLIDVQSGAVSTLDVVASWPRWSPDGAWLAFTGEPDISGYAPVYRIHPDGTGLERISADGRRYFGDFGLDWSPDGQWIVAFGGASLEIFRVEDGLTIPLPNTGYHRFPTWAP